MEEGSVLLDGMFSQKAFHHINNLLSLVVVLLAIYIIGMPFLPELTLALQTKDLLQIENNLNAEDTNQQVVPNKVIIPKIGVNSLILEGSSSAVLDQGIWRRPNSSTPGIGSNTVLVGHRFLYTTGPNTFYHLPKLVAGDHITIWWDNKKYIYTVYETKIVYPVGANIEKPSEEEVLTIYTCTPLWNPTHRFVVQAKPVL